MIAVPITAETEENAEKDIEKANKAADAIELRLDFLNHANETVLQELLEKCTKPTIVTFRAQNKGANTEETERLFLLKKAIDFGTQYIDIDFDTDKESIEEIAANKGNTKIILSHHNLEETMPLPEMLKLLKKMAEQPYADIIKIVTYAQDKADNDTMLALVRAAKNTGKPIIAFCMGPKGIRSRKESIKLGAMLTFASLEKGKESAEGQPTIEEMRQGD